MATKSFSAPVRKRGFDLSRALQDPTVRARLVESGGQEALAYALKLAEATPRGYGGPDTSTPTIDSALMEIALSAFFTRADVERVSDAQAWLLDNAALTVTNGKRRFRLTQQARAQLLDDDGAEDVLLQVLQANAEEDAAKLSDPTSTDAEALEGASIRELMRGWRLFEGGTFDLRGLHPLARKTLTDARRALAKTRRLPDTVPTLEACERQMALSDLLDPLGLMIGLKDTAQRGGQRGERDRFVGRQDALRELRALVDVLDSQSLLESVSRSVSRTVDKVAGSMGFARARMIEITADGGMGKSTLIAKFVLDHALDARPPVPFALLDFDRAALQPRDPASLVDEIIRQVALQFPMYADPLNAIRSDLDKAQTKAGTIDLFNPVKQLADAIETILKDVRADCFLLTLDTLELVQCDLEAMDGVVSALTALVQALGDKLVIVSSGRAGAQGIADRLSDMVSTRALELGPFDINEAREMVSALADQLNVDHWERAWTESIVGKRSDPPIRREPLTLRLAVELVRDTPDRDRNRLVQEISRTGQGADERLVGQLYQTRILNHIPEENARKLAWPGLVARRVTRQLAREVMAPICELTPEQADYAFTQLARHGWIVEEHNGVLHHKRDLRARTLPLMRTHDAEHFEVVVDALIAHFSTDEHADPHEATYYRLLRDDAAAQDDWTLETFQALAPSRDDFPARSQARLLIDAAGAAAPLTVTQLRRLMPRPLWAHIARTGASLRTLDDTSIDARLVYLSEVPSPDSDEESYAVWQYLLIKCGQWDHLDPTGLRPPVTENDRMLMGFFLHRLTEAGADAAQWVEAYPQQVEAILSERGEKNWQALAHVLPIAQQANRRLYDAIDDTLATQLLRESHWRRSGEISLRSIMKHGERSRHAAFPIWCEVEASRIRNGLSRKEFWVLGPELVKGGYVPDAAPLLAALQINARADDRLIENERLLEEIATALREWGENPDETSYAVVEAYCRIRQPEWIVPLGYALAIQSQIAGGRALERAIDPDLLAQISGEGQGKGPFGRRKGKRTQDLLQLLDQADRACALRPVVEAVAEAVVAQDMEVVKRFAQTAETPIVPPPFLDRGGSFADGY